MTLNIDKVRRCVSAPNNKQACATLHFDSEKKSKVTFKFSCPIDRDKKEQQLMGVGQSPF